MKNRAEQRQQPKEEYAVILDVVLDNQKSFKDDEVAQAVGTNKYTLLELIPKQGVILQSGTTVYIGEGKREEIQYIKRSLKPKDLSGSANSELKYALIDIINQKEDEIVQFFNTAGPITIRKHSLELIPGMGKKHLREFLDQRDEKEFDSFDDIKQRCPFLGDPQNAVAQRIIKELEGEEDFKLFIQ